MTREKEILHKVALLATGDEISQGDILNSNSQEIALRLVSKGIQVRMHLTVPDKISEIEKALSFLLETHQAVIITGGLGPTSDDLTRFALSHVIKEELVFNEMAWQEIAARLKKLGYQTPPESNRQQALFPKKATLISNTNGTAAGCFIEHNSQFIFMLPGPPIECLPMVDEVVINELIKNNFQETTYRKKWLLFGVSEGKIAEELDAIAKNFDCVTGYRICYPYIEFKLHSANKTDFEKLAQLIEPIIQPYFLNEGKEPASLLLAKKLETSKVSISILDFATGGALENTIKTPANFAHLDFSTHSQNNFRIEIRGLLDYWQNHLDAKTTLLTIRFQYDMTEKKIQKEIPFRGKRVIQYAVEFISQEILNELPMQ